MPTQFSLRIDDGRHRQATWLELLFDLAFVICVSTLATGLIESPDAQGLQTYALLFIPVWWVWNQYTWYASHFDNDDVLFRLLMLWGIGGTLFLARGIHEFAHGSPEIFIGAYLFLHLGMALGWMRVYVHVHEYRPYSRLKLTGIALGIALWSIAGFTHPPAQYVLLAIGTALQLLMPIFAWATVEKMISVHHRHLQERHGLFVIILLGECLVAISKGLFETHGMSDIAFIALSLLAIFGIWWIYFDWKYDAVNLRDTGQAFSYNYGHLLVYGGVGLMAAGIGIESKASAAPALEGEALMSAGVAIFLASLFVMNWLSRREQSPLLRWLGLGIAGALVLSLAVPIHSDMPVRSAFLAVLLIALICAEELRKSRIPLS